MPNFPVPDAEEVADGVERDRFVRHDDAVDIAKAHGMIDDRERSFNRFESIEERIVEFRGDQDHPDRFLTGDTVEFSSDRPAVAVDNRQIGTLHKEILLDLINDCGDEPLVFFDDHAMFSVLQKKDIPERLHFPLCPNRVIRFDQVFLDAFSRLGADTVFIVEDD